MANLSFKSANLLVLFVFFLGLFPIIKTPSHARTSEEYAAIFVAPDYYLKPEKLFEYGYDLGLASNCKTISTRDLNAARLNLKRWVKIASTDFEPISSPGVLNKRLFNKAFGIVEQGENLGKKEGKKIRSSRSFRNEFCPSILEAYDAPPGELGK